jgi:hypothetical protein
MDRETLERVRVSAGLAPGSWMAQARLARVLRRVDGQWLEAWQAATRATELAPDEPRTHFIAGLLALDRSEHRRAAAAFGRVCELRPDSVAGHTNRAVALMRGPGRVPRNYNPAWPITLGQAEQFWARLWLAARFIAGIGFVGAVAAAAVRSAGEAGLVLLVEIGLVVVVARWLWSRTTTSQWRVLSRMSRYDTSFATGLAAPAVALLLFAVASGLAFAGSDLFAVALGLGVLALAGETLVDHLRRSVLVFLSGPLIEPVSLLLAAVRQRPTASRARRALEVAIWRLLARLWLISVATWLIVVLPIAPAMVTRAATLLATVAAVEVWSSVLRRTARSAASQLGWLVRNDPLLPIAFCGAVASTVGSAGLAISSGTAAAENVVSTTGGLLVLLAVLYLLRLILAFVPRVLHWLRIPVRGPYAFPPHPGALIPYDRLEQC